MSKELLKMGAVAIFMAIGSSVAFSQNAYIGETGYVTLNDAFAAAKEGDTITLAKDVDVTANIPVTASVTLDLAGHDITNNVTGNRLFRLSDVKFTINGENGNIVTPESNTNSYGFVDFQNATGVASATACFVANNTNFEGSTDDGSFFKFRTNGQTIELNNVNVNMTYGKNNSIINGYRLSTNIKVNGGEYKYSSELVTSGVFHTNANSKIDFDGVTVETSVGPVVEVIASEATFKNCTMTNTATNAHYASCISASYGGTANVEDCTLTANYPLYVFNSGGTINVNGGTYNGNIAAIKVDDSIKDNNSLVNVQNGTFNGNLSVGKASDLKISGGEYTDPNAKAYCVEGYTLPDTPNADGKYVVEEVGSTGVEIIETETVSSNNNDVFTLNGTKTSGNISDLKTGIYIIGGKKVYIVK